MVRVNKEKCIGCSLCTNLCPEVFEMKEDGKADVKEGADLEKNKEYIKQSIEGCPTGAIEE